TITCGGLGRVVASNHLNYQKNDIVHGTINWTEYTIVKTENMLRKLDAIEFPLSYHVGIFGTSGFTAYGGFFKICKPKKEDKVFVSAAAGSVGNLVGQYAKLFGCYVVGCAGTKQKVSYSLFHAPIMKSMIDFKKPKQGKIMVSDIDLVKDEVINIGDVYMLGIHAKQFTLEVDTRFKRGRYFPDGIDIYFDNVGGEMLEVANMNALGRIASYGVISDYTNSRKHTTLSMTSSTRESCMIQGFLVSDFSANDYNDFMSMTRDYVRAGKLCVLEDISCGVESIPSAFVGLFRGDKVGKRIVQIDKDS
ncbi:LOW QUALITY PROTEIN: hypothetical protein M8C21_008149, partial [Ambrosia artemisiifolia]